MKIEFDDSLLACLVAAVACVAISFMLLGGCKEMNRHNERTKEIEAKEKQ